VEMVEGIKQVGYRSPPVCHLIAMGICMWLTMEIVECKSSA
jgi:hypothetical protein